MEVMEQTRTLAAVVKVGIDRAGMPTVDHNVIEVEQGQRVVWVGPSAFEIKFPEDSPFEERHFKTDAAVINVQTARGERGKRFKYDVVINGKRLDPLVIIK